MQHLFILLAALVFAGVTPFLSAPDPAESEWIADADGEAPADAAAEAQIASESEQGA